MPVVRKAVFGGVNVWVLNKRNHVAGNKFTSIAIIQGKASYFYMLNEFIQAGNEK